MVEIVVIVEWHICVPPGLVNVSKFMHSLMSDTANMAPSKLVPNTEPKSIKGRSIQQIDHVLILMSDASWSQYVSFFVNDFSTNPKTRQNS